jgi:tRNA threonylcarbamoyladenosine biosynthesis protein TsaE
LQTKTGDTFWDASCGKQLNDCIKYISNMYQNDINIYHFDVYRLSDIDEFYAIGGEEYFNKGICIIEWGEIIEEALPKDYIKINFEKDNNNENIRILNIELSQKYYKNITFM